MNIRLATPADAELLSELGCQAFRETFTHYDEQDLNRFLKEDYPPAAFLKYIQDPQCTTWLVEHEGRPVGYAQTRPYKLPFDHGFENITELHRIYVLAAAHGQGIGAKLMQLVFDQAAEKNSQAILLGVWSQNLKALRFYEKLGFKKVGEYNYPPIGDIVDREWIMQKTLPLFPAQAPH